MGYTLEPKKKIESIDIGAFSWPMMLQETGAGFVLGYGEGREPASYVYQKRNGGSPVSNDGFRVTAYEAKIMAHVMLGYISVATFINKEWEAAYPDEKERDKWKEFINPATGKALYKVVMGPKRLDELKKIAEWMQKSGGFKIT